MAGNNFYVAPALRAETHDAEQASGDDVITARYAWCEYDGKGDAEHAGAVSAAVSLADVMGLNN